MASITRTVAALLVMAPVAFGNLALAQERESDGSGPLIIQLEPTAESRGGGVKVIRGSAVHPDPIALNRSSKVGPPSGIELVGGDTLWLVDRKASVVTGCYLAATIVTGNLRDIRCENVELR